VDFSDKPDTYLTDMRILPHAGFGVFYWALITFMIRYPYDNGAGAYISGNTKINIHMLLIHK